MVPLRSAIGNPGSGVQIQTYVMVLSKKVRKMDRRTQKTQKAIREAFLILLGKKNIDKIKVAEISQLADIGRGTFYLHYNDVFDLYDQVEKDLYAEIERLLDRSFSSRSPDNLMNLTSAITEYIICNRETFLLFVEPVKGCGNLDKLKNLFMQKMIWGELDGFPSDFRIVECMFSISGVVGVLEEWLFGRLELSQKQIAESLFKIVQRFKPKSLVHEEG